MVWAMDRLGRSLAGLIDTLRVLEAAKVVLYLDQQAIDTTTPAGRMFFHITGCVRRVRARHDPQPRQRGPREGTGPPA
jgi:DNA invertase Pin-like site-specific DNA recombinase